MVCWWRILWFFCYPCKIILFPQDCNQLNNFLVKPPGDFLSKKTITKFFFFFFRRRNLMVREMKSRSFFNFLDVPPVCSKVMRKRISNNSSLERRLPTSSKLENDSQLYLRVWFLYQFLLLKDIQSRWTGRNQSNGNHHLLDVNHLQ